MTVSENKLAAQIYTWVYRLTVIGFMLFILIYAFRLIIFPYQLEFREAGQLYTVDLLMQGKNPYLFKYMPEYSNNFGLGYPLFVLPLSTMFGNTLLIHRLVSTFSLLGTGLIIFWGIKKYLYNNWVAFGLAISIVIVMFYGVTPVSRPDALGTLLYTGSIFIPIIFNFSLSSLLACAILSILGFYTKQYFILSFPCLILGIAIFISFKRALLVSLFFTSVFILSIITINNYFEAYFYNTTLSMLYCNSFIWAHTIRQLIFFIISNAGITLLACFSLLTLLYRTFIAKNDIRSFTNKLMPIDGILVLGNGLVFCSLFFKLGGNHGAFLTYYYQLLLPLLVILVVRITVLLPVSECLLYSFVIINLISTTTRIGSMAISDKEMRQWQKVERILSSKRDVLNSHAIAQVIYQYHLPLYNSGFSEYFMGSLNYRNTGQISPHSMGLERENKIDSIYQAFREKVELKIRKQQFDLITQGPVWTEWFANWDTIAKYYVRTDSIELKMPHTEQQWKLYLWNKR